MTDLQPILDQLARSRPGKEQFTTHKSVALFYSHGKKHGGCVYQVEDYANGQRATLESPFVNERRFVIPWRQLLAVSVRLHGAARREHQ